MGTLRNGHLAYILDSDSSLVLPFTDTSGQPLSASAAPNDLGTKALRDSLLNIDRRHLLLSPMATLELHPPPSKRVFSTITEVIACGAAVPSPCQQLMALS